MTKTQSILLAFVAFVWLVATPFMHFAPGIHGYFWPVVSHITLESSRPAPPPEYQHIWTGRAVKYDTYTSCDFKGMEWFLGRIDGRAVQVRAEFSDPPQVREAGVLEWDGLLISLDPAEVLSNSFAYVYHDCGFPWLVKTVFYDAATAQEQ